MTYPAPVKYLLIGKESTWGTAVTADKDCGLLIQDITHASTKDLQERMGISSIAVQQIVSGMEDPELSFAGDFQHGRMLEYIFGSVAHAETTGDWKHTFTISNTPPSFTGQTGNNMTADTTMTTEGLLIESAEFSAALNGTLQLSITAKGQTVALGTSASASVISSLPVFPHTLLTVNINGSPASEVQSVTINIAKAIPGSGGFGSDEYQQRHATELKIEYTATLGFSDNTYHTLFTADTVHEFELIAANGTALGSGQRKLSLTLENCREGSISEVTSVGGLTFVEVSGKGTLQECFSVDNISSGSW